MKKEQKEIEMEKAERKSLLIDEKLRKMQLDARKRVLDRIKAMEALERREASALKRAEEREKKVAEQEWLRRHDDEAQGDVLDDKRGPASDPARAVTRTGGLAGHYRGVSALFVRGGAIAAGQLSGYDAAKRAVRANDLQESAGTHVLCSLFAAGCAAVLL